MFNTNFYCCTCTCKTFEHYTIRCHAFRVFENLYRNNNGKRVEVVFIIIGLSRELKFKIIISTKTEFYRHIQLQSCHRTRTSTIWNANSFQDNINSSLIYKIWKIIVRKYDIKIFTRTRVWVFTHSFIHTSVRSYGYNITITYDQPWNIKL